MQTDGLQGEYELRINQVIDYINQHLAQELSLKQLAGVSLFSAYHFHRIFKAFMGETPASFISRIRLQQAAQQLCYGEDTITNIALGSGFFSSATFSRAFKDHFQLSPSAYRSKYNVYTEINEQPLNKGVSNKEEKAKHKDFCSSIKTSRIYICNQRPIMVAYIRHFGDYNQVGEAWKRLFNWAGQQGLLSRNYKTLGITYDNPDISPEGDCRYDSCLEIEQEIDTKGPVACRQLPGGRFAVFPFQGRQRDISRAYDWIYGYWLPVNGYCPANQPSYEIYNQPQSKNGFSYDIYIPIIGR